MAVFRVEKNRNYTVMSNYHLKDKSLTLKSKGLLSLILSLPDEWNYTTRGLAAICKEGVDCIGAALRELEVAGYLDRHQLRDGKGRITDTEYIIYEYPPDRPDRLPESNQPDTQLPYTVSPHTEKPYLDEPPTEKPAQYNTDVSNSHNESIPDIGSTHPSIQSASQKFLPSGEANPMSQIDEIECFDQYRERIEDNIEYDCLVDRYDKAMLDEIVELMLDTICGKYGSIRIGGAEYPAEVVKNRLLKINSSHIEYVMDCIKDNTTKINNIRAFMLTALYNAPRND